MCKVYFAGPIYQEDWREDIFNCNPFNVTDKTLIANGYTYAGPRKSRVDIHVDSHDDLVFYNDGTIDTKVEVFKRCISDIDKANAVFVWIDNEYRYGTLAELMYAYAKGLYIYVVKSHSVTTDELWFPLEAADVLITTDNIKLAWDNFLKRSPYKETIKITEKQKFYLAKELSEYGLELIQGSMDKQQASKLIGHLKSSSHQSSVDELLLSYITDNKLRRKSS